MAATPTAPRGGWQLASYVLLGLSIAFKLVPLLVVPFLVLAELVSPHPWPRVRRAVVGLAAGAATPFLIQWRTDGPSVLALIPHHFERGMQIESIYATLQILASWLGGPPVRVAHSHGAFEIWTTAVRDGQAVWASSPGMKRASLVCLLGTVAAAGLFCLARGRRYDRRQALSMACWVIGAATIVANVLSPQYMIWALPMLALAAATVVRSTLHAATLSGACLVIALLTTWLFPYHYLKVKATDYALIPELPRGICQVLMARNALMLVLVAVVGALLVRAMMRPPHAAPLGEPVA